jgi:hypothetical protein
MQAGEVDQALAISSDETAPKLMQARESASGRSSSKHANTTDARGQRSAVRNSNSRKASTTSKSAASGSGTTHVVGFPFLSLAEPNGDFADRLAS